MIIKLCVIMLFLVLPPILMILNLYVSSKANHLSITLSSFECGYDQFSTARISFSLHFFLLSVLFLVFDLEIIFLLPLPLMAQISSLLAPFVITLFIIILFLGTMHEWNEGSLNWH